MYDFNIENNVYIDELDDIGKKYNKTHHRTVKTNAVVKTNIYILTMVQKIMKKILNLKLVMM